MRDEAEKERIRKRLIEVRELRGFKRPQDAIRELKLSRTTYFQHENGSRTPGLKALQTYAEKYRVPLDWFTSPKKPNFVEEDPPAIHEAHPPASLDAIPMLGTASAGLWREIDELDETPEHERPHLYLPPAIGYSGRRYALLIDGESMNLVIPDGSYVICAPVFEFMGEGDLTDLHERRVHVERQRFDGLMETTIKELRVENGEIILVGRSSNPKWNSPTRLSDTKTAEAHVRGVVIGTYRSEL